MNEENGRRVALVTGAARRLGRSISIELARCRFDVWVHYRDSEDEAAEVVAECRERGVEARAVQADLRRKADIDRMIMQIDEQRGRLDLLVNNASSFYPTPFGDVSEAQFDELVGSNFKGPFFCSQRAAPMLAATKGQIIHLLDTSWPRPWKGYLPYCASKAALRSLTAGMAIELAPRVRVNAVAPGPVLPPEDYDEVQRQQALESTLLRRSGSPEAVAETVAFLATGPDWITGAVVPVDGGRSLT